MFIKADRDGDSRLNGGEAAPLLQTVVTDRMALRSIWSLADRNNDGHVTCNEFCVAMHLAKEVALGSPVPQVLGKQLASRMNS